MTATNQRLGLLIAAPGTSSADAALTLQRISQAATQRFPQLESRWAYTSHGVLRKLAAQGRKVPDADEALTALRRDGFTRVAVLSLHLSDGMEFGELAETVATHLRGPEAFEALSLSTPLMACQADLRRAFKILLADLPTPLAHDEGAVLVAHGSQDTQGGARFAAAAALCREVDPRLHMGCMLGTPTLTDTLAACQAAKFRKIRLLPFMVAAGYSARVEIAGPAQNTWRTAFTAAGIDCEPVIQGLADHDGIVDLWMNQIDCMLGDLE